MILLENAVLVDGHGFTGCRKTLFSRCQPRTSEAAEEVRFSQDKGFRVRLRAQSLWKGTASAVPHQDDIARASAPEGFFSSRRRESRGRKNVPQRLKPS